MFKILNLMLLILEISTENFYEKFHQSDYKVEFKWVEIIRYNKVEVNVLQVHAFKYNRTCTALNMTFKYNTNFGNDMQIVLQAYKFASNEYRLFPMRFELNFCDAFKYDIVGMQKFSKCGNFSGCPQMKGRLYHACNWVPDESKFPPYIPTGTYMAELQSTYHSREIWVAKAYIAITRPMKM